jgi:hypothetical protein
MGRNLHNRPTTLGFDHACDNGRLRIGCGNRSSAQPEQSLAFLDRIIRKLESEPSGFTTVLEDLMTSLESLRSQCLDLNEWQNIVVHMRQHRMYSLMLEDPYTLRATQKPRGYPGDALLLDFVYRHPLIARDVQQSSALGQRIYEYTGIESPPAKAVRNRRDIIAKVLRSADDSASIRGVLAFAAVIYGSSMSPFQTRIARSLSSLLAIRTQSLSN